MLFGNDRKAAKKNRRESGVITSRVERIEDWIPEYLEETGYGQSMGVFGGNAELRNRVILEAVKSVYGEMGVVVIHNNNNNLVDQLAYIREDDKNLDSFCVKNGYSVGFHYVDAGHAAYEPFCGIDAEGIVEIIYPDMDGRNADSNMSADALRAYCEILECSQDLHLGLDGLLYLCNLSPEEMEDNEMQDIPTDRRRMLLTRIVRNGIYNNVRADINAFAGNLRRIWTDDQQMTGISMVAAAKNRSVLTISVSSSQNVLEYLAEEMIYMNQQNMQVLLIIDSMPLSKSLFNSDFLLKAANHAFHILLSAPTIHGVFSEATDQMIFLSKNVRTVVLNQSNASDAEIFSRFLGQYDHMRVDRNENRRNDWRDEGSRGQAIHTELRYRIMPTEFCNQGEGAILFYADGTQNFVCKANRFH